jgi:peptidylprolyl isomerase
MLPLLARADTEAPANIVVRESGLKIIDLKEGTGATPVVGQTVKVDYTGWLNGFDDADGKFDSSKDRRKPLSFAVGTGRVIAGWDEGVLSMKIGGKRRLIIPSDLGYGKRGAGGIIPPDATLYFEVELLGIVP